MIKLSDIAKPFFNVSGIEAGLAQDLVKRRVMRVVDLCSRIGLRERVWG
jgi:hypothetical protein